MRNFQITLVRPPGFLHTDAFLEVAETLQFGLRSIGCTAHIRDNDFDANAINVLLGAHLLPPTQASLVPRGSIVYNLEQIGGPSLSPEFYDLACRHKVWDYSLRNIAMWRAMGCARQPVHVPLGYVPELNRILPALQTDIDVLFYGSLNPRRSHIVRALKNAGAKVTVLFGVYGVERDNLISRSKIVLNIHFYERKILEIVRLSYLLTNSKAVVTEICSQTEIENGLAEAVVALPYESLVNGCLSLLQDDAKRQAIEKRGFQYFSQRRESDILSKALQATEAKQPTPRTTPIPARLNLGSGKDWRENFFNVDVDSYWEPDAVLDFNHPLPIGKPLDTGRFGTIILENDSFDEIVANDALEHIPSLKVAMTSCLNLLKVGGLFSISVPYELSWGAWQDPTHVRAFNERSWLYYTDWFWYMGWTEARFELAHFNLTLSPVGKQLQSQLVKGEDLIRYPRAVDQMQVVLRKMLLTEVERQQVLAYFKRPERPAAANVAGES
jgi:SAM-dependent methyltransferase